ncbi:cysteine dioxygenase type 1-like [Sycon ciliatum]|uniref:cysteine dioxygenase type 1-like n=1 Tax=Sycon ciliatum TaxID=27933 RepID=UPI0020AC4537|eukprot:scpid62606/ scgid2737/ Cysteine dioxygenase type 1; Cysteine dioxygenase type I
MDLKVPSTLDDLISALHQELSGTCADVERVKWLMEKYEAKPEEYERFCKWDPHRYTRTLVDRGNGNFNLIVLCWGEDQGSSIHSHADSHCFMRILDGTMQETVFDWPNTEKECTSEQLASLQKRECREYAEGSVAYINDSMGIHRVENASHTRKAISLHLYSPPFDMCKTFDERTGHERTCRLTFCNFAGRTAPSCKPEPCQDA